MAYDLFPAVDATYNFPPEVRSALAKSLDLRNTVVPMTQTERNNLTVGELWEGRTIVNTTTGRVNRYSAATATWYSSIETSDLTGATALQNSSGRYARHFMFGGIS